MMILSSIVTHLQIKIAKQIDYGDQMEFELSSKHGKHIFHLSKRRPISRPCMIRLSQEHIYFTFETKGHEKFKSWKDICKAADLPVFMVTTITIDADDVSIDVLTDLCENGSFAKTGVYFYCLTRSVQPHVFAKLSEMFKISTISYAHIGNSDPALFVLPAFREAYDLTILVDNILDDTLLNFEARKLCIIYNRSYSFAAVANQILKQWFQKKRIIEWFRIYSSVSDTSFHKDIVVSDLPASFIWKNDGVANRTQIFLPTAEEQRKTFDLNQFIAIYSINREDKKLLVLIRCDHDVVMAQEYNQLEEVIQFKELEEVKESKNSLKRKMKAMKKSKR